MTGAEDAAEAMALIEALASEVGPRRPTSAAERDAAELVSRRLRDAGVGADLETFSGYSTFAAPAALIGALALLPAMLPSHRRLLPLSAGAAAVATMISEGGLVRTPVSDALARRPSQNVVATIEPRGGPQRTLCLVCHLDTSRSGLLFDPRFVAFLNPWIALQSAAVLTASLAVLLARARVGRAALTGARALVAAGLGLLAERELRGVDVPGANDNASGVGVAAQLAGEVAHEPLESTRVVFLATGCEESGLLGMQAFLRSHETAGWLFLNFDSVGGPATLRYIEREGMVQKWPADPRLISLARRLRSRRPELGLEPATQPIGLTYDATAVLARGGRALTFVAGDGGVIPNYHWPSDTAANVDPGCIARALTAGREMVAAVDRGEAD